MSTSSASLPGTTTLLQPIRRPWTSAVVVLLMLCSSVLFWIEAPSLIAWLADRTYGDPLEDTFWKVARFRMFLAFSAVFAGSYFALRSAPVQERFSSAHRTSRSSFLAGCILVGVGMAAFVVHFGRLQWGGYDFDLLVDVGWRTYLGQKPYTDFITFTPPGFIFPLKHAFQLFGATWNASLYLTSALAVVTFAWIVVLLRRLKLSPLAAVLTALSVEAAAVLSLCFWWYNNTTMLAAGIFYLSSLCLASRERAALRDYMSYAVALGLLLLTKPNIAGISIAFCLPLVLICCTRRLRLVAATLLGLLLPVVVLWAEGTSVIALLSAYRAIAVDRGGLNAFGFHLLNRSERLLTLAWLTAVSMPLWVIVGKDALGHLRAGDRRKACFDLLLLSTPFTAIYGAMTNGEWRDVDGVVVLLAIGLVFLGSTTRPQWMRPVLGAFLVASCAADLAYGAQRIRIYCIGPHRYFEADGTLQEQRSGFLRDARVSSTLVNVEEQIDKALLGASGRVFFGPRLLTSYALTGRPSPAHLPIYWEPGTSFPRKDTAREIQRWREQRFDTLVFLRDDYTFYEPELLQAIAQDFVQDDRYPALTVYHHR